MEVDSFHFSCVSLKKSPELQSARVNKAAFTIDAAECNQIQLFRVVETVDSGFTLGRFLFFGEEGLGGRNGCAI